MPLIQRIKSLGNFTDESLSWLQSRVQSIDVKKGQNLLEAGKICNSLFYIESGLLCGYYHIEDREVCNWIATEGDFATSYYSFISREKSHEIIECLENGKIQIVDYKDLQDLYKKFPETERAGRLLLEEYYSRLEERLLSIQFKTAKERYALLLKNRPEIIQRAPLGRIASYLGINQETLSRIRAEK